VFDNGGAGRSGNREETGASLVASTTNFWARWRVRTGYLVAALFLWLAAPTPRSIGIGIVVVASGLIIRTLAAGHLHKAEEITDSGPYAWTRNPLYLGSALLTLGFAIGADSVWSAALIVGYYCAFYPAVMLREEVELRIRFGARFDEFAASVPRFLPRPLGKHLRESRCQRSFSWSQYKRNREYQAAIGSAVGIVLLWARMLLRHG
jgi:protein-S-isoprenylcysteine O-methyltransferase Ste14